MKLCETTTFYRKDKTTEIAGAAFRWENQPLTKQVIANWFGRSWVWHTACQIPH